jgi:hypothetical protein
MNTMDRESQPYYVFLSLALMAFSVFVYWQKTHASAGHKLWMIVPATVGCLILSIWAFLVKTEPSSRLAWVANLGTFVVFEMIMFLHHA